jgi:DNA replication licensing factor MCM7
MALLQYKAIADYEKQLDAFQSFLEKFETSKTSTDATAEAIDGLHLDGDHTSDEYDFMDDVADDDRAGSRRRPKRKYMDMLQEVADRERQNIVVELDDLNEVRECSAAWERLADDRGTV